MDIVKVIVNTERLRIIQYLSTHERASASEIKQTLGDIPQTTLYRHLNLLEKSELITVAQENRIRGTVEKIYTLNTKKAGEVPVKQAINMMLLELLSDFNRYFNDEKADPVNDMLLLGTATLNLSDAEFSELLNEIGACIQKRLDLEQKQGRKLRRLTTISSPVKTRSES